MKKLPSPPTGDDSDSDDTGPGGPPGAELYPAVLGTGNTAQDATAAPAQGVSDFVVSVEKYHWHGLDGQPLRQPSQTSGFAPPRGSFAPDGQLDESRARDAEEQPQPPQRLDGQEETAIRPRAKGRGEAKADKPAGPRRQQPGREAKNKLQGGDGPATTPAAAPAPVAPAPEAIPKKTVPPRAAPKKAAPSKTPKTAAPKKTVPPKAPAKKTAPKKAASRQARGAARPQPKLKSLRGPREPRPPASLTPMDNEEEGHNEHDVVEEDVSTGASEFQRDRKRTLHARDLGDEANLQMNDLEVTSVRHLTPVRTPSTRHGSGSPSTTES